MATFLLKTSTGNDFDNPKEEQHYIKIFDLQGITLWESTTTNNSYFLQNDFLSPEIYFLQIDNKESKVLAKIEAQ